KSVIAATDPLLIRVSAVGVRPVLDADDYFIQPVGQPWTYQTLTLVDRLHAAFKFKRLLADSQATRPEGRMAFALALTCFPFIRSWLTTRPIFPHESNTGGEGKSFGVDRFAYLLYGESGLKTSTEAAARRASDPFVIYDDVDDMPTWMQQYLKRSATGTQHQSVDKNLDVENYGRDDTIHAFTAIKIPQDNPLLTRFWTRTYSKAFFSSAFQSESTIRHDILEARNPLLSFVLDVLAEAMRID